MTSLRTSAWEASPEQTYTQLLLRLLQRESGLELAGSCGRTKQAHFFFFDPFHDTPSALVFPSTQSSLSKIRK